VEVSPRLAIENNRPPRKAPEAYFGRFDFGRRELNSGCAHEQISEDHDDRRVNRPRVQHSVIQLAFLNARIVGEGKAVRGMTPERSGCMMQH